MHVPTNKHALMATGAGSHNAASATDKSTTPAAFQLIHDIPSTNTHFDSSKILAMIVDSSCLLSCINLVFQVILANVTGHELGLSRVRLIQFSGTRSNDKACSVSVHRYLTYCHKCDTFCVQYNDRHHLSQILLR